VGRFGWGIADQVLSSITNFALGFLVARAVSPRDFGAFSVAYLTYSLGLGAARAFSTEPLVIRFSAAKYERWRQGTSQATGASLAAGLAIGGACVVVGVLAQGPMGSAFLILGLFFGPLLLQDAWRFAFFARGSGHQAFLNDVVWTVLLFPPLVLLIRFGTPSVTALVVVWAAAGTGAALFGLLQARIIPDPMGTVRWIREQRDLASRFVTEFGVSSGGNQLGLYLVGAIAGLAELGVLRAGLLLLGPLNLLFIGAGLVAVPEGVRLLERSPSSLRSASNIISAILAASALLWGMVVAAVPDRIGTQLLGENWAGGRSVVLPLSIVLAAGGFVLGRATAVRALGAAGISLRARSIDTLLQLSGTVTGVLIAGAVGAAWGAATAALLRLPNWLWYSNKAFSDYRRPLVENASSPTESERDG
jgi:O-antigen/teichoic acid export membrane protein